MNNFFLFLITLFCWSPTWYVIKFQLGILGEGFYFKKKPSFNAFSRIKNTLTRLNFIEVILYKI
jgi:ABC-type proline/glycine betaine transport system substrate-binding protein